MKKLVDMEEIDMVQPFQLENSDVKGRLGLVSNSVNDIIRNKDYPKIVSKLVAEACLLTSLIGQSMELKWKLSLQIRGKGPVKLIATDYFNFGNEMIALRCEVMPVLIGDIISLIHMKCRNYLVMVTLL